MSLLIKRNKSNIFRIGSIKIFPGVTEIKKEDDIETLKSHQSWEPMIESKVHVVIEKESVIKEEGITADITKMKASDAISVIKETYAVPILQDMFLREQDTKGRSSVLKSIEDQISEMKESNKNSKDNEDSD